MKTRLRVAADLITACDDRGARPFIALEHLESNTGQLVADTEFSERLAPEAGAVAVEPGDVLFGKLRPYLAKVWRADRPVYASTELLCIRPHAGMDSRWLAYVCASRPLVEWAVASSDGTKMPRTSWEKLSEYRAEIPPLPQQRAVADYLDAETARIDALIEKKRRMVELIDGRLRDYRETMIQSVDGGSNRGPLRRACLFIRDGTHQPPERVVDGYPLLSVRNLANGRLRLRDDDSKVSAKDFHELTKRWRLQPDDIVLAIVGATLGKVGVVDDLPPVAIQRSLAVLRPRPSVAISRYLYHALSAVSFQSALWAAVAFSAQPGVYLGTVAALGVPLPPLGIQATVSRELDRAVEWTSRSTAALERQAVLLLERRQAVITSAVTGQAEIPGLAA